MPRSSIDLPTTIRKLSHFVTNDAVRRAELWRRDIDQPSFAASTNNLAHYLAFRRHDLRDVQLELMRRGLSSPGQWVGATMGHDQKHVSGVDHDAAGGDDHPAAKHKAPPFQVSSERPMPDGDHPPSTDRVGIVVNQPPFAIRPIFSTAIALMIIRGFTTPVSLIATQPASLVTRIMLLSDLRGLGLRRRLPSLQ